MMSGPNVISELEREWGQMRGDPETVRVFEGLQEAEPVLGALADLDDLVAVMAVRASVADLDRHDVILLALLRQAQVRSRIGDLAARTTLQLLLPGLKSLCRHPYVAELSSDERRAVLVAALWEEIRAPRSAWKPVKVGAQVIGRARGRVRPARGYAAKVSVELYGDEVPQGVTGRWYPDASQEQSANAGIGLLRVLSDAVADGRISQEHAQLIVRVQVLGEPMEKVAEGMGISAGAAGRRLCRARESLLTALCRPVPDPAGAGGACRRGLFVEPVPK